MLCAFSDPMTRERFLLGVLLVWLVAGCSRDNGKWSTVGGDPSRWFYITAASASVGEARHNGPVRDRPLRLVNATNSTYDSLEGNSGRFVVAIRREFCSMLVTGTVNQAPLPELRGMVMPVIADTRMEIHFLSRKDNTWYSTNTLWTRVVTVVEKGPVP